MIAIHPGYQPKRLESGAASAAQRSLATQASIRVWNLPQIDRLGKQLRGLPVFSAGGSVWLGLLRQSGVPLTWAF
jgi:hypothetical protein